MDNAVEHRKAFLRLLTGLTLVSLDSVQSMFNTITPLLVTDVYMKNPNEEIRFMLCKLMCWLYDNALTVKEYARVSIVESFVDKSEKIQKYLSNTWDTKERLSNNALKRLTVIMDNLYVREGEYQNHNWVGICLSLLMSLTKKSPEYSHKIYEFPLSKCPFNKLNLDRSSYVFNRSQPLTIVFDDDPLSFKPAEQEEVKKSDILVQGIRATQMPIFSPSLEQTLVVGKDNRFGDSFYQIDDKRKEENESLVEVKEDKGDKFKPPEITSAKKVKKSALKLFSLGNFAYGPQLVDGRIRYKPLGGIVNKGEGKSEQNKAWHARIQQFSVPVCREYRVGELPDIEIHYKDIIDPLRILALKDSSIASELFVSLFTGIYFTEQSQNNKEGITQRLGELLDLQQKHSASYQTVYVLHQIMIDLLKEGVYFPLSEMKFAHTEHNALNLQTSILAVEESILTIQQRPLPPVKRSKLSEPKEKTNPSLAPGLDVYNSRLWLQLARLYKQMNNPDYTDGIYSIISEDANIFTTEIPQGDIVTLVSKALKERINLKHSDCVNTTTKILAITGIEYSVDKELLDSLRKDMYESLERLSKWEEIEKDITKTRSEAMWKPENRDELSTLIRARMRCEVTWGKLRDDMTMWLEDDYKKEVILSQFSYEMALCSVIRQDLDRAAYYINRELTKVQQRWSSINSMSFETMHYLVQSVQKIHEFYEFLKLLKNDKMYSTLELQEHIIALCHKWKDRKANIHFDSMKTWDDILYSRSLFIDTFSVKFKDLKAKLNEQEETKDLIAQFYIQTAHAAYKKKMFECTDSYLRTALNYRSNPSNTSLALTYPIIKLKAKQHHIEGLLMKPIDRISKYLKIIEISNIENARVNGSSVQLSLLSFRLSQIVAKEYVLCGWFEDYVKCLKTCFEFIHNAERVSNSYNRAKVLFHFATFCDGILRQVNSKFKECILEKLATINVYQVELAITLIKNGFAAINLGYGKGNNLIPRILDVLFLMSEYLEVEEAFIENSAAIPAWIFLPWVNQFIAIMNTPASGAISMKFKEMAKAYPQPIIYALKVADANRRVDTNLHPKPELYRNPISVIEENQTINAWVEALEGLTYPEHRMKYWLELMKDAFTSDACKDTNKLEYLINQCYDDVLKHRK